MKSMPSQALYQQVLPNWKKYDNAPIKTLLHLKDVVHHGWPEYPNECPQDLREFWNFREDLSVENGVVLKRHCLVIPTRLRPQMLQIIHQGHMGMEKCLLKAKESIFWPGILRDIKELTANCAYNSPNRSQKKRYVPTVCPVFRGRSLVAICLTTKVHNTF